MFPAVAVELITMAGSKNRGKPVPHARSVAKARNRVHRLIAGPGGVYICDETQRSLAATSPEEQVALAAARDFTQDSHLKRIMEQLNQYVIGQDRAKVLRLPWANHYKRVAAGMQIDDVELGKSVNILGGPTGCGKQDLAQTLAKILDVLLYCGRNGADRGRRVGGATSKYPARLIQSADLDISRAEKRHRLHRRDRQDNCS